MTKQLHEYTWAGLVDLIERASEELYRRGYEQGKIEARQEMYMMPVAGYTEETPQAKRDRIVEQAKADVKELTDSPVCMDGKLAKFIVNKEKRTVVALLISGYWRKGFRDEIAGRGIAKCAPDDCFNVHIGKAIALRRALGLEVPAEYLNTPRPTEVRVGDKIRLILRRSDLNGNIETVSGFYRENKPLTLESPGHIFEDQYEIIDDSREGVTQ